MSPLRRVGRPFGYGGMAVVWLTLAGAAVAIVWALLPVLLLTTGAAPLHNAAGFTDAAPLELVGTVAIVVIVAGVVFGLLVLCLPMAAIGNAGLAVTAFFRSLRPSYGNERVTATRWTSNAIGPPNPYRGDIVDPNGIRSEFVGSARARGLAMFTPVLNKTAISLIPNRRTRLSEFWTSMAFLGFMPFGIIFSGIPLGIDYVFTVGWTLWGDVPLPLTVLFSLISVALAGWGSRSVVRAIKSETASWRKHPTDRPIPRGTVHEVPDDESDRGAVDRAGRQSAAAARRERGANSRHRE